jgi:hypothetical protein
MIAAALRWGRGSQSTGLLGESVDRRHDGGFTARWCFSGRRYRLPGLSWDPFVPTSRRISSGSTFRPLPETPVAEVKHARSHKPDLFAAKETSELRAEATENSTPADHHRPLNSGLDHPFSIRDDAGVDTCDER